MVFTHYLYLYVFQVIVRICAAAVLSYANELHNHTKASLTPVHNKQQYTKTIMLPYDVHNDYISVPLLLP